jgi:hypothetical protein
VFEAAVIEKRNEETQRQKDRTEKTALQRCCQVEHEKEDCLSAANGERRKIQKENEQKDRK